MKTRESWRQTGSYTVSDMADRSEAGREGDD